MHEISQLFWSIYSFTTAEICQSPLICCSLNNPAPGQVNVMDKPTRLLLQYVCNLRQSFRRSVSDINDVSISSWRYRWRNWNRDLTRAWTKAPTAIYRSLRIKFNTITEPMWRWRYWRFAAEALGERISIGLRRCRPALPGSHRPPDVGDRRSLRSLTL